MSNPDGSGDPILDEQVERALAPYKPLLRPETLQAFRDVLRDVLRTHPVGSQLLDRVRPRVTPHESGDVRKAVFGDLERAKARMKKRRGGA